MIDGRFRAIYPGNRSLLAGALRLADKLGLLAQVSRAPTDKKAKGDRNHG
jgi:hypothetical protein